MGFSIVFNRDNTQNFGELIALDGEVGVELWRFNLEARSSGGPAVIANGVVYVTSNSKLYALDAELGQLLWEFGDSGDRITSTPIISNGALYVAINNQIHKFVSE